MCFRKVVLSLITVALLSSCGGGGYGSGEAGLPIAKAGGDLTAEKFSAVTLDGRGSENGEEFEWKQIAGPYTSIKDAGNPVQSIVLPSAGVYKFQLTVKNGNSSSTDDVVVTATERSMLTVTSPLHQSSVTDSAIASIAGKASGNVARVTVTNETNQTEVDAVLQDDGVFVADNLTLEVGDNKIVLQALSSSNMVAARNLIITRTRQVLFQDPLRLSKTTVSTGATQDIAATVALNPESVTGRVELVELNSEGELQRVAAVLRDDGNTETGDQYRNDGEYSAKFQVGHTQAGRYRYRVRVNGDEYSNIVQLDVFGPRQASDYGQALVQIGQYLEASGLSRFSVGSVAYEKEKDSLLGSLRNAPGVKQAVMAPDRRSVEIVFHSGLTTEIVFDDKQLPVEIGQSPLVSRDAVAPAVLPEPAIPGSFGITFFSPFYNTNCNIATVNTYRDLSFLYLPPYNFDAVFSLTNESASVENLKHEMQVGILDFFTHGALATVDGEMVSTLMAEDVTSDLNKKYQEDLDAKRLVVTTYAKVSTDCITGERSLKFEKKYLLTPRFFEYYIDQMPHSLVNLQSCQSLNDGGRLAETFLRKGALAVLGFTNVTYDLYSSDLTGTILYNLQSNMALGDAVKNAKETWGENSSAWWEKTQSAKWGEERNGGDRAELQIVGGSGALAFRLSRTQVLNGSFENGLMAWEPQEHGAQKVVAYWLRI